MFIENIAGIAISEEMKRNKTHYRLAVAGAEQKGSVAVALSIVAPGAPAGSELNDDVAPSQAWDAFDEFDL